MNLNPTFCSITILYNPSEEVIQRLCVESHYCKIIVDNTPDNYISSFAISKGIKYIWLNENRGIATAQNIAINWAKELGYEYVIFFDQDSEYNDGFIEKMFNEYQRIKQRDEKIATLGPVIVDKSTNELYKNAITPKDDYKSVETIISSGSIVETANFDIIGGLDDKLFIDLVDHEWCWRAKSFGYKCYQTSRVSLNHKVGNCNKTVLGFPIIISAPFRYYYKYRNYLWMLSRSYVPLNWKIKGFIRRLIEFIIVPYAMKNASIYEYMFKGIKDGIKKVKK